MNIQQVHEILTSTLDKLDNEGVNDRQKKELQILVLQLENQLEVVAFDPLMELDNITIVDTKKLKELVKEVDKEIKKEEKRKELIAKIISSAKTIISASGLPVLV